MRDALSAIQASIGVTRSDFDLHQRNCRDCLYIFSMDFTLARFRVLLAAIFLIAGSVQANTAFSPARGAGGSPIVTDLSRDRLALAEVRFDGEASAVAADNHDCDQNGCTQDCRMNCIGSTASGCCATAIPIAGCNALDRVSITACGITETGFLATGINPEALLRPPRSHV